MADQNRFQHADRRRIRRFAVDSATVIEIGDMLWQDTDDVKPASDYTWDTDLKTTRTQFAEDFVGVAFDASASGETDDIAVYTRGTFVFECAAATFEIGDGVGPAKASGNALEDQKVVAVPENDYGSIMTASKRYGSNTTGVEVEIYPHATGPLHVPQVISLGAHDITSTADVVTDWPVSYPFKLVAVRTINRVSPASDTTLTIDNGTTSLDDTHATGTGAAGAVVRTLMDDASGDDIFTEGDILSVTSDGAAATGEVEIQLEVRPFLHHD